MDIFRGFLQFFPKIYFALFFSLLTFILGCFVGIMVLITVIFKKGVFMKCFFCQNVKNAEDVKYCASCNAAFCGACSRGSRCRNCNSLLKFLQ